MKWEVLFLLAENNGYLHRFLVELAPHDRCKQILDWSAGGQVLLDYITLVSKLEQIKLDIERDKVELQSSTLTIDFLFLKSLSANFEFVCTCLLFNIFILAWKECSC